MSKALRLAILGAGPVGLEAAIYARELKLSFTLYERGRVGEHLRRWGHVKLFSPFGMNVTSLARKSIHARKAGHEFPDDEALLTGREHVEQVLVTLAESLGAQMKTETQVISIGRRGFLKHEGVGDAARAKQPFALLLRDKSNSERIEEADVVLDCTGTYAQHRWLGDGGIPAPGELALQARIAYGLDDVAGDKAKDYANRATLVLGSGYSAATTVCNLARVAEANHSTWITWLARAPHSQPLRRIPSDPLRERDRLAVRANNLATRSDGNVEFHAGTTVDAIEPMGQEGFRVTSRCAGKSRVWEVERIVANIGYTPDTTLYRELHVHECYATLGPMKVAAALLGQKNADCLRTSCPAGETLRNPEPNFYILGAKSFGRNAQFLMRTGFEQVRDVFRLIMNDAALDLYKR